MNHPQQQRHGRQVNASKPLLIREWKDLSCTRDFIDALISSEILDAQPVQLRTLLTQVTIQGSSKGLSKPDNISLAVQRMDPPQLCEGSSHAFRLLRTSTYFDTFLVDDGSFRKLADHLGQPEASFAVLESKARSLFISQKFLARVPTEQQYALLGFLSEYFERRALQSSSHGEALGNAVRTFAPGGISEEQFFALCEVLPPAERLIFLQHAPISNPINAKRLVPPSELDALVLENKRGAFRSLLQQLDRVAPEYSSEIRFALTEGHLPSFEKPSKDIEFEQFLKE